MITNKAITYYHKTLNPKTRLEEWERYIFPHAWVFGGKGASIYKGYENANDVEVRIDIKFINDKNLFKVDDIIVIGYFGEIEKQSDLKGTEFYNVTSVNINDFGHNPHIHLGGK